MGTAHFYGHFTFCTSERERGKGRTPRFCAYATLVHEAPGVSFITVAYAQNGAESCVRDFSRQGCDL